MSIEVQNVTKLYGEQKALDDVSFSIGTGEIVGFLGPNGAGKSTMMKILTCYIPQSEGTARVCGIDTQDDSITIRKKVGYLPEHNPLYLEMYVKEYLAFMAGVHKVSKDRIPEMIRKTGLEP
ncbi:MAG TPA: gliding motility-associated ABC transporter ATP-binding subunit GldA, partial [Cryomorphaceae bacterium]|nr:gliding motility-associated ABC transporter ATP-binding subunit GldA [Cryomorphaceae bacterium]